MMQPMVSCVLATGNRRRFLARAILYFLRQSHDHKELIIVDDGQEEVRDLIPSGEPIRYLHHHTPTNLGCKLNRGIAAAGGEIIQKLDDDDYYHPSFLATTTTALLAADPVLTHTIVALDSFLVLPLATGTLHTSGEGWSAGGTLCFLKALWERIPFRDIPAKVDYWFLQDSGAQVVKVRNPELYILVRHDQQHAWETMGNTAVTTYFLKRPLYEKSLVQLLRKEDAEFYLSLRD